jgi:histidyl-tRNA synthetase
MKPFLRLSYRAARSNTPQLSACFIHKKPVSGPHTRSYTAQAVEEDEMPKDKEKTNFQLKVPKGTKDWEGRDMVIRDKIFGSITEVFKRHGAVTIDTLVNLSNGEP